MPWNADLGVSRVVQNILKKPNPWNCCFRLPNLRSRDLRPLRRSQLVRRMAATVDG